jgi:uncharacterized RDD family membrane protein YckC
MSITATRSTGWIIAYPTRAGVQAAAAALRTRRDLPMEVEMNAFAQAPAATSSRSKLDSRRVLAALVDLALLMAGAALILAAAGGLDSGVGSELSAVIAGWTLFYYFACESGQGQTLGKRLLKLRVVRADGGPSGMREILVRTALRPIDAVGVYLVGLVVMLITGERRQRLGDLAAGTIVVAAEAPAPAAAAAAEEAVEEAAPVVEVAVEQSDAVVDEPAAVATESDAVVDEPAAVVKESDAVVDEPAAVVAESEVVVDEPAAVVAESGAPVEEPVPAVDKPEAPVEEPLPPAALARADEADPEVTVRSVETVSAIDLVMGVEPSAPAARAPERPAEQHQTGASGS